MIIIRQAKEEDQQALENIFYITRQITFNVTLNVLLKKEDYEKSVAGEEVWVAQIRDEIVGFISLWLLDNFIHNLFIHPNWQNKGIGKKLLQKAEERLLFPITLKVTLHNYKACQFYLSQGFEEVSIHKDPTEPYILYRKK